MRFLDLLAVAAVTTSMRHALARADLRSRESKADNLLKVLARVALSH